MVWPFNSGSTKTVSLSAPMSSSEFETLLKRLMLLEADLAKHSHLVDACVADMKKLQGLYYAKFHTSKSSAEEKPKEPEDLSNTWPPAM